MGDLAPRARHVLPVAPIETLDGLGALADGGAHAVHGGIAATDDDDPLAPRVEPAVLEGRHAVAESRAVAGRQVFDRLHDVAEAEIGSASCRERVFKSV